MIKKSVFLAGLFLLLMNVSNVFADSLYEKAWTVAGNGVETAKTVFDLGQKPWLFLELSDGLMYDWMTTVVVWNEDGNAYTAKPSTDIFTDPADSDNGRKIWSTINDAKWAEIEAGGLWTLSPVSILVTGGSPEIVTGSTNFTINGTVVPEPVSVFLFLLGAGAMMARRCRRSTA